MSRIFAVTRTRGPSWDDSRSLEGQKDWPAHAAFMDALLASGFVLLGGPLEQTSDVLLIVRAEGAEQIRARFAEDCWTRSGHLELVRIAAWELRLGALG